MIALVATVAAIILIILLVVALAMAGIFAMYQSSVWFDER